MNNNFIPQAVDTVKLAIEADDAQQYEKALQLYQRALDYFITGLKYEQNPTSKKIIQDKLPGYFSRAEAIKKLLSEGEGKSGTGSSTATLKSDKKDSESEEKSKLRSALSSAIVSEKPNIKWSDVAGLEGAKSALKEAVILPIRFPQLFTGKRKPWKGILLYGPPGTGKSYLAKAVASETDSTFYSISSADLVSKWQGESERLVREIFTMARESSPAVIFIDEIDSLCTNRSEGESESARRIKTEFLVQMDGVGNNQGSVLVLGATNVPWELDPAMRRRFQKRVYIPLPEADARTSMFKLNLGDTPNSLTEDDFYDLGLLSEGYSGSDIKTVVQEALMEPLRKCQTSKQFLLTEKGEYYPCNDYPNCPSCPMELTYPINNSDCFSPKIISNYPQGIACRKCNAVRISLFDIPSDRLLVPTIDISDFHNALKRSHSSVAQEELERFENWTAEFGQEG